MGKAFSQEIDRFPDTVRWVTHQNSKELNHRKLEELGRLLKRWSDGTVIVVGSGGSYSAAVAWSVLHRRTLHRPCYAVGPLELGSMLEEMTDARVFLLSAEGKNRDILNSAELARRYDVPCASLTLTEDNPLVEFSRQHHTLYAVTLPMDWGKDGYLATNTLVAMILIASLAYRETTGVTDAEVATAVSHQIREDASRSAALSAAASSPVVVVYGPESRLFALDLESKVSEAALTICEIADYRQFAHGRHLQLAQQPERLPVVLLAYTNDEEALAKTTHSLFPANILVHEVRIHGNTTEQILAHSILSAHVVTEAIARAANKDPGQPNVPEFGRQIYALNSADALPLPPLPDVIEAAVRRKLGCSETDKIEADYIHEKARTCLRVINEQAFRAAAFDFDGTLCSAHERFVGMRQDVANELTRLLGEGLFVGVATGRGGSVPDDFRKKIPQEFWKQIWIGSYNGSVINRVDEDRDVPLHPEMHEALEWLEQSGVRHYAGSDAPTPKAGQLGLRIANCQIAQQVVASLAEWIVVKRKEGWRVYSSGHSVDLIAPKTCKLNILAPLVAAGGMQEVLRMGDAGSISGNDFELLDSPWGLSCDRVSMSLARCWNFAPAGVRQADAALYYLKRLHKIGEIFRISLSEN